ncbi:MAG: metallophosphoesterase [Zetaproteobacteria bacterium]|nr:MAG: metallophosphoesterase [Zetaproteobacteria bacterium]
MKILALSDEVVEHIYSPRVKELFGDVNVVVGCGDLPDYYLEFVVSMLNVPLFHVPGNHDLSPSAADRMGAGEGALPRDCGNLDGRVVREQGLLLAGLGGSVRYRPDGMNQYTQTEMGWRVLRMAPRLWLNRMRHGRALDVLITHAPPKGIHDGTDPAHVGFVAFNRFVAHFRPRFLLHGHSHVWRRDAVTATQVGATTVLNVCPYRVIEIGVPHAG